MYFTIALSALMALLPATMSVAAPESEVNININLPGGIFKPFGSSCARPVDNCLFTNQCLRRSQGQQCVNGCCTPPTPPPEADPDYCGSDSDCPKGYECTWYDRCIPKPEAVSCKNNFECSILWKNAKCVDGHCNIVKCSSHQECEEWEICYDRECEENRDYDPDACSSDKDCSDHDKCVDGRCEDNEAIEWPCDVGGVCWEPGRTCVNGQCKRDKSSDINLIIDLGNIGKVKSPSTRRPRRGDVI